MKLKNILLLGVLQFLPVIVLAQQPQSGGTPPPTPTNGSGGGFGYNIINPIPGFPTLQDFVLAILNIVIVIATPIVVLFIIFAGFKYVTAQGEPGKIKQATEALTYAVIGGILILGAVAIAQIIKDLVNGFAA